MACRARRSLVIGLAVLRITTSPRVEVTCQVVNREVSEKTASPDDSGWIASWISPACSANPIAWVSPYERQVT